MKLQSISLTVITSETALCIPRVTLTLTTTGGAGSFIAAQSTLLYTNSDFNYHIHYDSAAFKVSQGLQIMAKGSIYNVSGEEMRSSDEDQTLTINAIYSMIGQPNTHTETLAQALDNAGFEHTLPEPYCHTALTIPKYL